MSFIKKNKTTIIAVVVFIVALIAIIQAKNIMFPDEKSAIYGDRLKGIESVKIDESSKKKKVDSKVSEAVSSSSVVVNGRIVNIILTVNGDVAVDTAKAEAETSMEAFSSAEKKYYDFQVFVQKSEESGEFPIIGYRHHTKDTFTWTKDRTGSE